MGVTKIHYYISENGENPISDFLDSLSEKQQTKLLRIFQTILSYGLSSVLPHIKKLQGYPLWEIRVLGKDNIRVIYITEDKNYIVFLHGFIKKTQKTSSKDTAIALKRFAEWKSRISK